jgi:type IV secretion system protein VirB6
MALSCAAPQPDGAFISGLLTYIDCQAQSIGEGGYQALAAPGSAVALGLGGLLALFIGLFGYQMLLGRVPDARQIVTAVVKIGVVLTLATSWSAYRTLIYDVTMHGPAELAAEIGGAADIPGSGGGLVWQLQRTDNGWIELGKLGIGRNAVEFRAQQQQQSGDANSGGNSSANAQRQPATVAQIDRSINRAADESALRTARLCFLVGTVGVFAILRLFAGLLLALGPLFALFLLFEATRDLFHGWLRALAWTMFCAVSTTLIVGVEIAFLNPWLGSILALRRLDLPSETNPAELLAFTLIFALTTFAVAVAATRLTRGIPTAFPTAWSQRVRDMITPQVARTTAQAAPANQPGPRSRARVIADAVASAQRRENAGSSAPSASSRSSGLARQVSVRSNTTETVRNTVTRLTRNARRRTQMRASAGAVQRDGAR